MILTSNSGLTYQYCENASVRITKEVGNTVGGYIIRISTEVMANISWERWGDFKIIRFCSVDNGGQSTGVQYAKKPPSNIIRDKKRCEMHKSDTKVTRSQSKNTENVDLSDIEIARNSCSTGEPAIPDIGHVQSPVSVHSDLNCCSTPVWMHEPYNDLISDHDDPNRDSGHEEGAESEYGTHQVPNNVVDEQDWEQTYFLHTIGQDYDNGYGLKFKCSLCKMFFMLLLQKEEHSLYAETTSYWSI